MESPDIILVQLIQRIIHVFESVDERIDNGRHTLDDGRDWYIISSIEREVTTIL